MKHSIPILIFTIQATLFADIISSKLEFIPSIKFDSLKYPKKNIWKTQKLEIDSVILNKKRVKDIGSITYKDEKRIFNTPTDISAWTENILKYTLQRNGISVVESNPTLTLKGEILEFQINENDSLHGKITIEFRLFDKNNDLLFKDVFTGIENIKCIHDKTSECFKVSSNMVIDLINNFLNTPEITQAVLYSYKHSIILHDFNYLHENLISGSKIPEKKHRLKKMGTVITCLGIAPIIAGLINKQNGNDQLGDQMLILGSATSTAGLTTASISVGFDLKYRSFQSKFQKRKIRKSKPDKTSEKDQNIILNTMLDR